MANVVVWTADIVSGVPTPTPTPGPTPPPIPIAKANMKFQEFEPYLVKQIQGPLESTARQELIKGVPLSDTYWTFSNLGGVTDDLFYFIYEVDSDGNVLKNVAAWRSVPLIPYGGPYPGCSVSNNLDFSRRYEIGEVIYLAFVVWGNNTEEKPSPPYGAI